MALPIIDTPAFTTKLPTGREIRFRPFTVKEQKNLLFVAESGSEAEVLRGIVDLVDACTYGELVWMDEPVVNLEHAFLHIRSKSVGEIVELNWQCKSKGEDGSVCNHKSGQDVDVRTATHEEFPNEVVAITDNIHIVFDHLTVRDAIGRFQNDDAHELIFKKTKMVVHGEEVHSEFTRDEFETFLNSFPPAAGERVDAFFKEQPSLLLRMETKCPKCGNESHIELRGVLNFFG